jgi:deoxyribonuclease IV
MTVQSRGRLRIRLGVHVSIAGGMEKAILRAREVGCSAMQIFSRNPRAWKDSPLHAGAIASFRAAAEKGDIDPIVIHTPYLLNLAAEDADLHRRSTESLARDIARAGELQAGMVVTHLGSAGGSGKELGLKRVARALRRVLRSEFSVKVLMENTAGGGNTIGGTFEELAEIIDRVGHDERLMVCFDSCHGYAAGYDFRSPGGTRSLVKKIEQTIGVKRLALLHLNDCAGSCGAHLDRHAHIGEGQIGLGGFTNLLTHPVFKGCPMILETPKEKPTDDPENLARIRGILRAQN